MQPVLVTVTEVGVPRDTTLVNRARDGDMAAFDVIAANRLPGAYRLAAAILGNDAEAADATQNALVAAWRELPRLRDPGRFDAWFRRILVNECRMAIRRRGRVREVSLDARADPGVGDVADTSSQRLFDTFEAVRLLDGAFERLEAEDRVLVVLHYLEDRPLAEIAEIVHMPVGTVKWRLHEARGVMLRALETVE
jgi:RNA polymerase sigma-70 factor (ECF subfamily)